MALNKQAELTDVFFYEFFHDTKLLKQSEQDDTIYLTVSAVEGSTGKPVTIDLIVERVSRLDNLFQQVKPELWDQFTFSADIVAIHIEDRALTVKEYLTELEELKESDVDMMQYFVVGNIVFRHKTGKNLLKDVKQVK